MKKFKKILAVILIGIITALTLTGCTESTKREIKSIKSDRDGGLNCTIIVYTYTGKELARYEGKCDLMITTSSKVLFDISGKRYIYYNCPVEVIEK